MTTPIHDTPINAALADATYVDGLKGVSDAVRVDRLTGRLTEKLAQYVVNRFRVVDQSTESNFLDSESSFTMFEDRISRQKYIPFRGTERLSALKDVLTDLDTVFLTGLALNQRPQCTGSN